MPSVDDRERERAAEALRGHFVRGRLSVEELSDRLELALSATHRRELRHALAELPADAVERGRLALEGAGRFARRALVLAVVVSLWWVASLVLLVGWVASVVADGLSLTVAAVFAGLWLGCTFLAWRLVRR